MIFCEFCSSYQYHDWREEQKKDLSCELAKHFFQSEENESLHQQFICIILVTEKMMINKYQLKYNFTVQALTHVQITFWIKDDLIFILKHYKIQIIFIINIFC